MKPCSKNRTRIVLLAVDGLDAPQAQELRAHLQTCEGCRHYLDEISRVAERLAAAEAASDIQASESFHRRLVGRLRSEGTIPVWETLLALFRATMLNRRVALAVVTPFVLLVGIIVILEWRSSRVSTPTQPVAMAVAPLKLNADLPPTIANYQMVAAQSLDKLDELLTQQGNKNLPATQNFTVSSLMRVDALN
jgi:anti-sigma factor RsiW